MGDDYLKCLQSCVAPLRFGKGLAQQVSSVGAINRDCQKGPKMTNTNNAVPVMKLQETHADAIHEDSDGMAMFRIWTLLTGGETTRDLTVANRRVV